MSVTPKTTTVLVVDDDETTRELVATSLRTEGYRILEAGNPTEAAEILGANLFAVDILFADILMPTMNGPEFAREMLAMQPNLKVIFATGADQTEIRTTMELVPHKCFLQKPFSVQDLRRAVAITCGEPDPALDSVGLLANPTA